jgi:uncharacterized protein involved in exopolysaccharide biosynthesis
MRIPWRGFFFIVAILGANAMVWGICLAYLKFAPVSYTSEFILIIPRSNTKGSIDIQGVGQANDYEGEVFGSEMSDPRSDYSYLLTSYSLLEKAAKSLKISVGELGTPKTKAIDNSSLLRVEIKAKTGELARRKAQIIYDTLVKVVTQLRQDEENLRSSAYEENLEKFRGDYEIAKERLTAFQKRTGFNSPEQINLLAASIEEFRRTKAQTDTEQMAIAQQLETLSNSLGVSTPQAVQAFTLKADRLFQISLKEYTDARNYLAIISNKWGENHPEVIKARSRLLAVQQELENRGKKLLGKSFNISELTLLNLNESEVLAREKFYEDMISLKAQQKSLLAKSQMLQQKLVIFQQLYRQEILNRATYEELQRDARMAEALFSSRLGATQNKNTNPFSSYPLFQMLVSPNLPDSPTSPKKMIAYLGAVLGSLLTTGAIALLWFRSVHYAKSTVFLTPSQSENLEDLDNLITEESRPNGKLTEPTPQTLINPSPSMTESP